MRYELDEYGHFICDCPDETIILENWTTIKPPQPCFTPRFVGERDNSGEWVGEWVDDGPQPKTPEQEREEWKSNRADLVSKILVTTSVGNTFDGDEISQGRMARAILSLQVPEAPPTTPWVLADNTVVQAGISELSEALLLAGAEQARLWIKE